MNTLGIYRADYGTAFFCGEDLIKYVHENDGDWRSEYFNPIIRYFGIEPIYLEKLSEAQKKQIERYES